jgi:hypothetical protein
VSAPDIASFSRALQIMRNLPYIDVPTAVRALVTITAHHIAVPIAAPLPMAGSQPNDPPIMEGKFKGNATRPGVELVNHVTTVWRAPIAYDLSIRAI